MSQTHEMQSVPWKAVHKVEIQNGKSLTWTFLTFIAMSAYISISWQDKSPSSVQWTEIQRSYPFKVGNQKEAYLNHGIDTGCLKTIILCLSTALFSK